MAEDLKKLRSEIDTMAADVWAAIGVDANESTDLQREVVGTFVFGMTYAAGRLAELTLPQVHALALLVLREGVGYTSEAAAEFTEELIHAASDQDYHDTLHSIIHQGIDGHEQWMSGRLDDLRANIMRVLDIVNGLN